MASVPIVTFWFLGSFTSLMLFCSLDRIWIPFFDWDLVNSRSDSFLHRFNASLSWSTLRATVFSCLQRHRSWKASDSCVLRLGSCSRSQPFQSRLPSRRVFDVLRVASSFFSFDLCRFPGVESHVDSMFMHHSTMLSSFLRISFLKLIEAATFCGSEGRAIYISNVLADCWCCFRVVASHRWFRRADVALHRCLFWEGCVFPGSPPCFHISNFYDDVALLQTCDSRILLE